MKQSATATAAPFHREEDDLADRSARRWAHEVASGTLPDIDARWQIAAAVRACGVARQAAVRYTGAPSTQMTEDIAEELDEMFLVKIVGRPDRPATLDLERIRQGTSLVGWARNLARTAAPRAKVKVARRAHTSDLVDPEDGLAHLADDRRISSAPPRESDISAEAALSGYESKAAYLRRGARAHLRAEVLRSFYNLPDIARLVDIPGRDELLAALEASPDIARLAASGRGPEQMRAVFSDWDEDDRRRLVEMDRRVAHVLVVAALTPIPPPRREPLAAMVRHLSEALGDDDAAEEAVDAWARSLSEVDCSELHPRRRPEVKSAEDRCIDAERWQSTLAELSAKGLTVLGSSPDEADSAMRAALGSYAAGDEQDTDSDAGTEDDWAMEMAGFLEIS